MHEDAHSLLSDSEASTSSFDQEQTTCFLDAVNYSFFSE